MSLPVTIASAPGVAGSVLADSDVGSTDSFPILDIDELNDEEYGIPPANADTASISLDDVLFNTEWNEDVEIALPDGQNFTETPTPSPIPPHKNNETPSTAGSLLKYVFLQAVSQQIITALERIDAGIGCAVAAWGDRIATGTSHGFVMAFTSQTLRWCCQQNKDQAAVTSLDYNEDGTRLLAGFARGIVCMYESSEGTILRRVEACGGGPWGVLRVCWVIAGTGGGSSAVVADTGGSVWLLRFTRTLGIRGTKVSCLFSGARGEVCAVEPLSEGFDRWGGVLALATLSRVVVVWGVGGVGGARPRAGCQASLLGPSDSLPLLAWQPIVFDHLDNPKRPRSPNVLCSARGHNIQFHQIKWGSSGPKISPMKSPKPLTHKATAVRWLGARRLAVLDSHEMLYLWETGANAIVDMLDLSNAHLVYANAHFKGVATGGKVSEALARAGAEALGGSITNECITGALFLLGRIGLTRITARTTLAAAHHHADMGRWVQALETIVYRYKSLEGFPSLQNCLTQRSKSLFNRLVENPITLTENAVALATIDSCTQIDLLETLWGPLWDALVAAKCEKTLLTVACKRASEGLLPWISPGACQQLVNHMMVTDTQILQKALLHIPLKCMDLHQVLTECRRLELWSAWVRVTAATAPDDPALPLRELLPLVGNKCREPNHSCPGDVLLLYTADCFAGRIFPTGSVSISDRPLIGQEVLRCLLYDPVEGLEPETVRLPHLRSFLLHDTGSTLRMLEMSFTQGPFSGPLGKQKRLAMGLALQNVLQTSEPDLFTEEEIAEIVYFTSNRLINGSLPADVTLINHLKKHFSKPSTCSKANVLVEASWLGLLKCGNNVVNHLPHSEMLEMVKDTGRLRVKRFLKEKTGDFEGILETFLNESDSENEMFAYLEKYAGKEERMIAKQVVAFGKRLASEWPEHTAQFLFNNFPELIPTVLATLGNETPALLFTEFLYKQEVLDSDLASRYLELLCILQPDTVLKFLNDAPSSLLPEAALRLVKKHNIYIAEPKCLEATGDLTNALKVAIQLMLDAKEKDSREQLAGDAYSLCTRAAKVSGPGEAESFWRQLIEGISNLPEPPGPPLPALLLEGAAYHLPLPWLVGKLCSHGGHTGALRSGLINLLDAAKDNAEAMAAASRLTGKELHIALATALRGKRVLPVTSTLCGYCHTPLHSQAFVRAYCCGHAFHLDCDPVSDRCGCCGKSTMEIRITNSPQITLNTHNETPQQFPLWIVAPPRPDLEGVI